ncbi:bile acid:sodium symporter family protein [Paenibacillus sp. FSL K6-2441]|uniref:bile acid:sodium symporter family protein n=1 Tax=Paenibacillus TaxID=44249 RepID=UPI0030DDD539
MLQTLNRQLNKLMPLITPTGILIGVLCGSRLASYTYLSPWLFAFMTFAGSISLSFKDFLNVLKKPLPLVLCLFILHLAMPLMAMGMGHLAFPGDAYTITGFILAAAIPTGVSSFVWVSIYKGNIALTLSIILIDTLLAPFVVPGILALLVGTSVRLDAVAMMTSLFWMIVVPSLVGMVLNQWTQGKVITTWGPWLNPFSKLAMASVVAINGAVVAPYLTDFSPRLLGLAAIIVLLAAIGYALGCGLSRLISLNEADKVALVFNGGMRNISAGAVLAVTYFPAPVAVPVVLGMVFQQVMASLVGLVLGRQARAHQPTDKTATSA